MENLYTVPHPSQLAQSFLAYLPYYLATHQVPDFITCSSVPVILAAPAAVAVWSGWVGIGQMTGFGEMHPLPGIWVRRDKPAWRRRWKSSTSKG